MTGVQTCALPISLSPLATLRRGYSVLQRIPAGPVVRTVNEVSVGEDLHAKLIDGRVLCTVKAVMPDSSV